MFIICDIFRMSTPKITFFSEVWRMLIMPTSAKERIKELCNKKGVSLNQAEKDCGFGKGYISKMDKSKPNSDKLKIMAEYFDTTTDYIINGKSYEYIPTEAHITHILREDVKLSKAIQEFCELSPKNRNHVIELIHILSDGENNV